MMTNHSCSCFAAPLAKRPAGADYPYIGLCLNTVKNLKSCVASLYGFCVGRLHFDREDELFYMCHASLVDASPTDTGSVKGSSVASFQNFYPLKHFYCISARSAAATRSVFFERVARKKARLLATYKKVDDKFKKGSKCMD